MVSLKPNQRFLLVYGLLTFLFVSLCLAHFFSRRPLWLDETFILENIQKFDDDRLFGPLEHSQSFPRVYLVLIKHLSQPWGYPVLALRFLPFLAMLAGYLVWSKIYRRMFGDTAAALLAIGSFAASYHMSYYAVEFKPYSMDVLVVGLFCLFLMDIKGGPKSSWRHGLWMMSMPFLLLYSYAGFFIFWILGYRLLRTAGKNAAGRLTLGAYAVLSLAATVFVYQFDVRHAWESGPLMSYWDSYFLCSQSFGCFMETFGEGVRRLSTAWFGKGKVFVRWGSFLIPFFLYGLVRYGFVALWKERGRLDRLGPILAVLFVELAVLGLLKKYPFTGDRITLFLAPLILAVLAQAMFDLRRVNPLLFYVFTANYILFLLACYLNSWMVYGSFY